MRELAPTASMRVFPRIVPSCSSRCCHHLQTIQAGSQIAPFDTTDEASGGGVASRSLSKLKLPRGIIAWSSLRIAISVIWTRCQYSSPRHQEFVVRRRGFDRGQASMTLTTRQIFALVDAAGSGKTATATSPSHSTLPSSSNRTKNVKSSSLLGTKRCGVCARDIESASRRRSTCDRRRDGGGALHGERAGFFGDRGRCAFAISVHAFDARARLCAASRSRTLMQDPRPEDP